MTKARDELMSHTARCQVLDSAQPDRMEWLADTIEYMASRYPGLSDLELTQLESIGRQFIKPVIAHGAGFNAVTERRPDRTPVPEDAAASAEETPELALEETPELASEETPELALAASGAT